MRPAGYRWTLATLLACAVGLVCSSTAAAAGWLAPSDISATGENAAEAQVAMSPDGEALAVWVRSDGQNKVVEAAAHPVGGSWSPPLKLSMAGADATEPQVAVDPAGEATAVWIRAEGLKSIVETSTRPRAGEWSTPRKLSPAGLEALEPQVAVTADGEAVVVWAGEEGASSIVRAVSRPAGGEWSAIAKLSGPNVAGHEPAFAPRVAIDATGEAVAVWERFDGEHNRVEAAARPRGGSWSQPVKVSAAGQDAEEPGLALSPDGEAVVGWQASAGQPSVVEVAARPAGAAWTTPSELSPPGQNAGAPSVAIDSADDAVALWNRAGGPGVNVVESTSRPASGQWSAAAKLTPAGEQTNGGEIAADPAGDAVAIWRHGLGSARVIEAATAPIGGEWSPAATLSSAGAGVGFPQVAIDSAGEAVGVWTNVEKNTIVQAAAFDRLPPTVTSFAAPTSGAAGVPLSFSVSALDDWSLGTPTWSFGDGAGAAGPEVAHTFTAPGAYEVTASVPDAVGNTVTRSATVQIGGGTVPPPIRARASAGRLVRLRGNFALLQFSCPSGSARCEGVAELTATRPKPKRRTITLARGPFSVPAGAAAPVRLRLTRAARTFPSHRRGTPARLLGEGLVSRKVILRSGGGRRGGAARAPSARPGI